MVVLDTCFLMSDTHNVASILTSFAQRMCSYRQVRWGVIEIDHRRAKEIEGSDAPLQLVAEAKAVQLTMFGSAAYPGRLCKLAGWQRGYRRVGATMAASATAASALEKRHLQRHLRNGLLGNVDKFSAKAFDDVLAAKHTPCGTRRLGGVS